MSKHSTSRDPFKFALQEEKLNTLKKLTSRTNRQEEDNNIEQDFSETLQLDQSNEYLKSLIDKFKNEIDTLKSYINRINTEVRKSMSIQLPSLTEIILPKDMSNSSNSNPTSFEDVYVKTMNDAMNRLINVDYLNPIFSIYDSHILNIEKELQHYKNLCGKYENKIGELTQENKNIRESFLIRDQELKEFLKIKTQTPSESNAIMDMEFLTTLEDRNNALSKENEILALNYQKVSKELFDFSLMYTEKYKESIEKIHNYDKLFEDYSSVINLVDSLSQKNQISEVKIAELTESVSKLEVEKESYFIETEKLKNELTSMSDAILFYKNFIEKMNSV